MTERKNRTTDASQAVKAKRPLRVVGEKEATQAKRQTTIASLMEVEASERMAKEALQGKFCWSAGLGWLFWNGQYWESAPDAVVVELARKKCKAWYSRALGNAIVAKESHKSSALKRLMSKAGVAAIVDLCRGQLIIEDDWLDADRHLLNTPTGVVDLRTSEILPHDPEYYMTKITAVGYAPGAKHADWDAALSAVRPDAREWLQTRAGNSLTGEVPDDDVVVFFQGGGENGKSTLVGGFTVAAGSYYRLVSDKVLLDNPKSHNTELTDLRGLRCAAIEELPEGRHLNAVLLKKITGQEITARRVYRDDMTFGVTHTMFVTSNYVPAVAETDWGTWRRLALLKFPYTFVKPDDRRKGRNIKPGDPGLRDRVRRHEAVLVAALAWEVEGAIKWYKNRKVMPPLPASVQGDTRAWRSESDLVFRYWHERLAPDQARWVISAELTADFNDWLEADGHQHWSSQTIAARFNNHELFSQHKVVGPKFGKPRPGVSRRGVVGEGGYQDADKPGRKWYGVRFREPGE